MPLVFDERKLLPAGVHEATLEEVRELFGRFQKSDRRAKLFAKLDAYINEVKRATCGTSVIIDGSFVMGCVDAPEDIDLILVLPADWDTTADLRPYQYNLVSKKRVKKHYGFDAFAVSPGSEREQEWVILFTRVSPRWCEKFGWPEDTQKGIVRVLL